MAQVRYAKCRSCNADAVWMVTIRGKNLLVDASSVNENTVFFTAGKPAFSRKLGHIAHFTTCPDADSWRKKKGNT